jgi:hypothetical protein
MRRVELRGKTSIWRPISICKDQLAISNLQALVRLNCVDLDTGKLTYTWYIPNFLREMFEYSNNLWLLDGSLHIQALNLKIIMIPPYPCCQSKSTILRIVSLSISVITLIPFLLEVACAHRFWAIGIQVILVLHVCVNRLLTVLSTSIISAEDSKCTLQARSLAWA